MPTAEPPRTLLATAAALAAGDWSSTDLLEALLARADARDGAVGAYLHRFDGPARAAAAAADRARAAGRLAGPLHGVPVAVKDIVGVVEAPSTGQSRVPPLLPGGVDAPAVARLRAAGAVIVGTTTLNEFAFGPPDPDAPFPLPRLAHDPTRWAGGSSSGSGSGVAAGFFPAALLGSDTGGSIRIPAAFNGVAGFKPTFGAVPVERVIPFSPSADTVGPLAVTAADCALVHRVLTDEPGRPLPEPARLAGRRIGVDRAHRAAREHPSYEPGVDDSFEAALAVLAAAGAELVEVEVPGRAEAEAATFAVGVAEAAVVHRDALAAHAADYGPGARATLELGAAMTPAEVAAARAARAAAAGPILELLERVDLLVSPTTAMVAPTFDVDFHGLIPLFLTTVWNAVGAPAISIPMAPAPSGLPLGLQLVARPGADDQVLAAARAVEDAAPGWARH